MNIVVKSIAGVCVACFIIFIILFMKINAHEGYRLYPWQVHEMINKAENGDVEACSKLRFHFEDIGAEDKVLYWLNKGAALGNANAQYDLYLFLKQNKQKVSDAKALENLFKSANQNYVAAQFELGELFRDGILVEKNMIQAEKWLRSASNNGSTLAMYSLSKLLVENYNEEKKLKEALEIANVLINKSEKGGVAVDYQAVKLKKIIEAKLHKTGVKKPKN